ncbi:MAG: hypothetical protein Q9M89_08970 [Persephonella sp.]|nr:hypothetical protein [Persephonella sp.]
MIKIDYTNVMAEVIGERDGILREELLSFRHFVVETHSLIQKEKNRKFYFCRLPYQDTSEIKEYAGYIRGRFDSFVVIGIGGSSLGARMLFESLTDINHNIKEKPKIFFLENVDPEKFKSVLEQVDIKAHASMLSQNLAPRLRLLPTFLSFYLC